MCRQLRRDNHIASTCYIFQIKHMQNGSCCSGSIRITGSNDSSTERQLIYVSNEQQTCGFYENVNLSTDWEIESSLSSFHQDVSVQAFLFVTVLETFLLWTIVGAIVITYAPVDRLALGCYELGSGYSLVSHVYSFCGLFHKIPDIYPKWSQLLRRRRSLNIFGLFTF